MCAQKWDSEFCLQTEIVHECFACLSWCVNWVCVWLPDKVQEGIRSADLLYRLLLGELMFRPFPGVNDKHHDDADDDSNNGGGGVVDHCPHPHFTGGSAVQGCHACGKTGSLLVRFVSKGWILKHFL